MIKSNRIAVVMPMFNEVRHVADAVRGIPDFVDHVVVVDDGSFDGSGKRLEALADPRVHLVTHRSRRGVGVALATGFCAAIEQGADLVVTMDSDGQMAPADLPRVLEPLVNSRATYVKGNRFAPAVSRRRMPPLRRVVNRLSSAYFSRVLGQPALRDVHCGYTAMTVATARLLVSQGFHDSYGVYNDILSRVLAMPNSRIEYVPVEAIYGDERSHLRVRDVFRLSALALRIAIGQGRRVLGISPQLVSTSGTSSVPARAKRNSQQAA